MRVVLLIRSLDIGGAERQLVVLAQGLKGRGTGVHVLTFYPGGRLCGELEAAGVPVSHLRKRRRWDVVGFVWRLVRWLRRARPQVLYAFLPAANILAACVRFFLPGTRIIWGLRASNMEFDRYDGLSRVIARLEAKLSFLPDAIIVNSEAGRAHHLQRGFPADRMHVIENGIDTERFRFDAEGRRRLREEWGIREGAVLIGLAARLDPMKGHETFLEAAGLFAAEVPNAHFACVGGGPPDFVRRLKELAFALGLQKRLVWAGSRHDMAAVYSAFDIATSSSFGEGFSNAIAEAMACERICVVTDAGDSARIVGATGWVVPPRDPQALAKAWAAAVRLSNRERSARGVAARHHVTSRLLKNPVHGGKGV